MSTTVCTVIARVTAFSFPFFLSGAAMVECHGGITSEVRSTKVPAAYGRGTRSEW
jgi:hypothetical protein